MSTSLGSAVNALYRQVNATQGFVSSLPARHQPMFATCMHLLQVTDVALDAYVSEGHAANGRLGDVQAYGVVQMLFVLQDAMKHLWEAAGVGVYSPSSSARHFRQLRNLIVGHPSHRDRNEGLGPGFGWLLSTGNWHQYEFGYLSYDWRAHRELVDLVRLIADQQEELAGDLAPVSAKVVAFAQARGGGTAV